MIKSIETVKVAVTNKGRGPYVVNTMNGPVTVERGATSAELLVSKAELESVRSNGTFAIEERGAGETVERNVAGPRLSKMGEQVKDSGARVGALEERIKALEETSKLRESQFQELGARVDAITKDDSGGNTTRSRRS